MRAHHRGKLVAVVVVFLLGIVPASVRAQQDEPKMVTVSLEQVQELEQWTGDFLKWQEAVDQWLDQPVQRSWYYFLDRHPKPAAPVWLKDACTLLAGDQQFSQGCEMLDRWDEGPLTIRARKAMAATVTGKEAPTNTVWWKHVHLDGLWSTTQSNVSAFGLFGMHMTVPVRGRMQVFVAPGILLVNVPTIYGSREVKAATDWGITYRLFDAGRNTVNFNVVHAWMLGGGQNLVNPQMTLAGFSLSFRPRNKP